MALCIFCLEVTRWIAEPMPSIREMVKVYEMRRFAKDDSFRVTSAACQFCKVMHDNLQTPHLKDVPINVKVRKRRSCMDDERGLCCKIDIYFRDHSDGNGWKENMGFALWVDEDSPGSMTIVTRPYDSATTPEYVCNLTKLWLNDCQLHHSLCSVNDTPPLPTRILKLSGSTVEPFARLIETNGMRGRYCALSHCWGPKKHQPLRTIRENFQDHLTRIPFERLPKTFRDVVKLVLGLGMSFIWVDSLCIIQDDADDWQSEAKVMGRVYKDAILVIAAAGSRSSKGGLFTTRREQQDTLRLPYKAENNRQGSINATLLPRAEDRAVCGPLGERAWVVQEWYLAQRIVFFMYGGMTWQCNQFQLSECADYHHLRLHNIHWGEVFSWLDFLGFYSRKKLTYHTDRLHALRGIISEMERTRLDPFLFEYGVWDNKILEQVLWRKAVRQQRYEVRSLELPTWSWAAKGYPALWVLSDYRKTVRRILNVLKLTGTGSLQVSGQLFQSNWTLRPFDTSDAVDLDVDRVFPPKEFDFEPLLLPGYAGESDGPAHLMMDAVFGKVIMGIARFDEDPITHAEYLLVGLIDRRPDYQLSDTEDLPKSSARSNIPGLLEATEMPEFSDRLDKARIDAFSQRQSNSKMSAIPSVTFDKTEDLTKEKCNCEGSRTAGVTISSDIKHRGRAETNGAMQNQPDYQAPERARARPAEHHSGCDCDLFGDNGEGRNQPGTAEEIQKTDHSIESQFLRLKESGSDVYCALVLEPIGNARYKRIGLAMLYPHAIEAGSAPFSDMEII